MAIPQSLQWEIDQVPRNHKITHGTGLIGLPSTASNLVPRSFPDTIEEVSHLLSSADRDSKAVVPWGCPLSKLSDYVRLSAKGKCHPL